MTRFGVAVLVLCLGAGPLQAQGGSAWCLRGSPPPDCSGFVRIEIRGGGQIGAASRSHVLGDVDDAGNFTPTDSVSWTDIGDWIGAELGYAVHVNDSWAVGASIAGETGNETTRVLLRARVRRWLGTRAYSELLPGVFHQRRDVLFGSGRADSRNEGATVEARVGLAGLFFVSARFDLLDVKPLRVPLSTPGRARFDPGGYVRAFSFGGGLEGKTAIFSSAAVLAILVGAAYAGGLPAT